MMSSIVRKGTQKLKRKFSNFQFYSSEKGHFFKQTIIENKTDKIGHNWTKLDRIRQNRAKSEQVGHNWTKFAKMKQNWTKSAGKIE